MPHVLDQEEVLKDEPVGLATNMVSRFLFFYFIFPSKICSEFLPLPCNNEHGDDEKDSGTGHSVLHTGIIFKHYAKAHHRMKERPPGKHS